MRSLSRIILASLTFWLFVCPATAAWYEARSPHFIIYSEQKPNELRRYAEQLERFDQAVRLARSMKDPRLTDSGKLTIYVLPNERSLAALMGDGIAGIYFGRASGAVAFVHRDEAGLLEAQFVFNHEYVHHLMLQNISAALPGWVKEGYAEFFATAEFLEDGSVRFGAPPNYRGFGLYRTGGLSAQRLVAAEYEDLTGAEWESIYGKGWLLAHYLTFEPSRSGQIELYLNGIQRGIRPIDSARSAFGDLGKLEADLRKYRGKDKFPAAVIPVSSLSVGEIKVRALSEAETAIMRVRMRIDRGAYGREARDIASDARRIAERFPNDPVVQTVLARAELGIENHSEALAAAKRAVAAAPDSADALIIMARALIEIGRKDPPKADWASIRQIISKANRLDTDDPEPLMLFHETYLAAGERPTANAVEGLLYALAVAPHDDELRLLAVRQLVDEGRFGEAATAFGPIAYDPHAGKWRDDVAAIMNSIKQSDRQRALQEIDAFKREIEEERSKRR